jgi:hypothetical protein
MAVAALFFIKFDYTRADLYQRWRALKRGLLLQITNTLPRRRTILQSRWRCLADFSEESTFMAVVQMDKALK